MARPERVPYSEELAREICDVIRSSSLGLRKLCAANPHWPPKTNILSWRATYPYFNDLYSRAKSEQIEALVDDIIDISDDDSRDTEKDAVGRARLRCDNRRWLASKLMPKVYGDNKASSQDNAGDDFISKNRDKL